MEKQKAKMKWKEVNAYTIKVNEKEAEELAHGEFRLILKKIRINGKWRNVWLEGKW